MKLRRFTLWISVTFALLAVSFVGLSFRFAYVQPLTFALDCVNGDWLYSSWACEKAIRLRVGKDEADALNRADKNDIGGPNTVLYQAAALRDRTRANEMLAFLLAQGVNLDHADVRTGQTALHAAVVDNDPQAVKLLLKHGARTNIRDVRQHTPLELAQQLQQVQPAQDRSRIIQLLNK
jgi:hypothetical protein